MILYRTKVKDIIFDLKNFHFNQSTDLFCPVDLLIVKEEKYFHQNVNVLSSRDP